MAGSSASLHEDPSTLAPETVDRHRAIVSLMEELEAVDWYDQRLEATTDPELAGILAHHRDDEKEHASMLLEWLRRHDPHFAAELRTYLGEPERVTEEVAEKAAGYEVTGSEEANDMPAAAGGSLGIGSLQGQAQP
jgi:ferritin-like protein